MLFINMLGDTAGSINDLLLTDAEKRFEAPHLKCNLYIDIQPFPSALNEFFYKYDDSIIAFLQYFHPKQQAPRNGWFSKVLLVFALFFSCEILFSPHSSRVMHFCYDGTLYYRPRCSRCKS
jgi:hypothetical protein